jgi:WD40 repeat protein
LNRLARQVGTDFNDLCQNLQAPPSKPEQTKGKHNDTKREQTASDPSPQSSSLKSNQPIKLEKKAEHPDSTPQAQGTILSEYAGHSGYSRLIAWSPDGTRIVSSDSGFSESNDGGILHIWSVDGGAQLFTYDPHAHSVREHVAWSPDGTRIALGQGTHLTVWNADGSGLLFSYESDLYPYPLWSPDSTRIASISEFRDVDVWNADGSGLLYTIEDPISWFGWYGALSWDTPRQNTSVAWSPNGTHIASGYGSGTIKVWNADGSGQRFIFESKKPFSLGNWNRPDPHAVDSLTWSPNGTRIASTSHSDEFVKVWNADGSGLLFAYKAYKKGTTDIIGSVVWSPDGTRIASRNREILQIWNADGSGQLFSYKSNNLVFVGPLFWSPDGKRIASVTSYGTILRVWSVTVPVW